MSVSEPPSPPTEHRWLLFPPFYTGGGRNKTAFAGACCCPFLPRRVVAGGVVPDGFAPWVEVRMSEVEEVDLVDFDAGVAGSAAGSKKLVEEKRARIRELAEWDQLDRQQRRALGLPLTDTEWAKVKGLNPRRVGKYRTEPFYSKCVTDLRDITAKRIAPGGSAVLADVMLSGTPGSDDLSDYTAIKSQLAALARQGDARALELWLKNWGKPFLDEETANRVTDLASLSDEALVVQLVDAVNPTLLADVLCARGFSVVLPGATVAGADSAVG